MKRITNDDAIKLQRSIMLVTGIWPKRYPSMMYKLWNAFNYCLAFSMFAFFLRTFFILTDFSPLVQNWNIFITYINYCIKLLIIHFKKMKLLRLIDFINNPIFEYHRFNLDKYIKRSIFISNTILRLFQISMIFTLLLMDLRPVFSKKHRQLPLEFSIDLIEISIICYVVLYALQVIALISTGFITVALDSFVCSVMGLVAAHFRILRETIISTTDLYLALKDPILNYGKSDKEIDKTLSRCVKLHLEIINFAELIEDIFSYYFLVQLLSSAFNIVSMGFIFTITSPGSFEFIFTLAFLGSVFIQITIFCVYGNEIIIESLKVQDACYMTQWIYCGPNVHRSLFLIMERAKRPVIITAGKFVNLSLASLLSIFKTGVSYGTVLRQMYSK